MKYGHTYIEGCPESFQPRNVKTRGTGGWVFFSGQPLCFLERILEGQRLLSNELHAAGPCLYLRLSIKNYSPYKLKNQELPPTPRHAAPQLPLPGHPLHSSTRRPADWGRSTAHQAPIMEPLILFGLKVVRHLPILGRVKSYPDEPCPSPLTSGTKAEVVCQAHRFI